MEGHTGLLKKRIEARDMLLTGCIVDARSGAAVEMFHECGYDVLMIDREHTLLNSETILEHIRLARALGLPCMVRAADSSYHEINRVADQAPDGIYVPRIRTREEVEQIMRTVKYPPLGQRGLGASCCPAGKYMGWDKVTDQIDAINHDFVVGIQIETAEALENLDAILSVPGLDVAVVGNDDLSIGMGIPGQWTSDKYVEAVMSVIAACERHGVLPGIACADPARLRFWKDRGMRLFWAAVDICLMWEGARSKMANIQSALNDEAPAQAQSQVSAYV